MLIETQIEKNLIQSLTQEDSQWTYRPDIKTESDIWNNIKKIIENNNRDMLKGIPLSDIEFQRIKNQLVSSNFYDACLKLKGENGSVQVKIERENENIMLIVFNRAMKAGGSSVYEIINQFSTFSNDSENNRRFDLTFLINGLPLIHAELKNGKNASYLEAFYQIKEYIKEGHFKGIFSFVQMFIVSNVVQTKYIAANDNMQKEFLTCWTNEEDPDKNVSDLFEFAKQVLRIPAAHDMVTDYCQLDASKKQLILLRPYQIQAIEAIRRAYSEQKSGYIWHTTGSGKTLTSYKASKNMLTDIPNLDKTVFLIDRRDLDDKTNRDFKSYADDSAVALSDTQTTLDLEKKLTSEPREMIVTTIQKLQALMRKYASREKDAIKIKQKKIAFVVDECHRTVTKDTQIEINKFFPYHMWYGFTGTPIFSENMGTLGATTENLYGPVLHKYTIKNALHDKSVLGFQVERKGPKGLEEDESGNNINEDFSFYNTKKHMLAVLDIILNKSVQKFGLNNGTGKTYEAILTVGSIARAQKYYELIKFIKEGKEKIKIDENILKIFPDFPKTAVTYSLSENKVDSSFKADKMQDAIDDYNFIFNKNYTVQNINDYNDDLTERFSRKSYSSISRIEQLDLVIVVDRLLTGFDAPCISTIFIDRPPMVPHKLIQAFSRTNRLFDKNKTTGYVVTFQSPGTYKNDIDNAIQLFTSGGSGDVIAPPFVDVEQQLIEAISKLRAIAPSPDDCKDFYDEQKKKFCYAFQKLDSVLARIKGYIEWTEKDLEKDYDLSVEDYNKYAAHYLNFMDEKKDGDTEEPVKDPNDPEPDIEYELLAYGKDVIDYIYVLRLIQTHTRDTSLTESEEMRKEKGKEIQDLIDSITLQYPKIGKQLKSLWDDVKNNIEAYKDKDIIAMFEEMKNKTIDESLHSVAEELCIKYDDVRFSADNYMEIHEKEIPYLKQITDHSNPKEYSEKVGKKILPLDYYDIIAERLQKVFVEDVLPYRIDEQP